MKAAQETGQRLTNVLEEFNTLSSDIEKYFTELKKAEAAADEKYRSLLERVGSMQGAVDAARDEWNNIREEINRAALEGCNAKNTLHFR